MDHLQQGKQLAQEGNIEEAMDSLLLALENDKENPDIHFYIGLCYSSLEEFGYAKYHYQLALSLDPNHDKTKLMWDGIKDVESKKPPERRKTFSAAAKTRKKTEAQSKQPIEEDSTQEVESKEVESKNESIPEELPTSGPSKIKVTEDKWEKAFPMDTIESTKSSGGSGGSGGFYIILLVIIILIGVGVYYYLTN